MDNDPEDPKTWFRLMVLALRGLQQPGRNVTPARDYLKFVEQHRGREVAEAARVNLRRLEGEPKWQKAYLIPV